MFLGQGIVPAISIGKPVHKEGLRTLHVGVNRGTGVSHSAPGKMRQKCGELGAGHVHSVDPEISILFFLLQGSGFGLTIMPH